MLTLGIEFLTGSAVLTDAANRERAEWPPHPARIFMALVAAHYEHAPLPADGAGQQAAWEGEKRALLWLETAGAPAMHWPEAERRNVVKVYVPVNDASVPPNPAKVKETDLRSATDVLPDHRSRQERTFPSAYVGSGLDNAAFLYWPDAPLDILSALGGLVTKAGRVGHSSSLVRMWLAGSEAPAPGYTPVERAGRIIGHRLRVPAPGLLAELDQRFNAADIETFFSICDGVANGTSAQKRKAKEDYAQKFGQEWTASSKNNPPLRLRPSVTTTAEYVPVKPPDDIPLCSPYDSELIILTKQDGPVLGLEATGMLTAALRGYLLEDSESKPEWFTGHKSAGTPAEVPHLAILPLAYVGAEYADGHVLGLALAIPSSIPLQERAACLSHLLTDGMGDEKEILLKMGRAGEWTVSRETRGKPAIALRSSTWTEPSTIWASMTPVVLDRHPKTDPTDPAKRSAWRDEVAAIIRESCVRSGLPSPDAVDVDKTSWHRGAPRSRPGSDGMPLLPVKPGAPARQQIHVLLKFKKELKGPVFLGAGRYRGYGLCKPLGPAPK